MRAIDNLPAAVKKEIRTAMEDYFERYQLYKYTLFQVREARVTASYEDRPYGPTNVISDQTASVAIYNVDEPARRQAFCERLEQAVYRLPHKERFIITERYMKNDLPFDYVVYNQLMDPPVAEATYTKIKNRAMAMLALALGIQIDGLHKVLM
ncbi:ArpU family phage packaging/lysis transcriptional regulator [Paenibacillus sp. AR247]|uniref:ArpU family phage packaging/lysis transcriptional regulator n=1 Tax=Paenibacillus sp. AR247 TaxID=1631599 RepID=UPI000CF9A1E1|nr:ArpU family phage packaging/lysis transcriptional regulator [Paenibacillus sp. AR247]PQP89675.1 transcriptional regulator [Paenibacillus sp. AR247]